MAFDPSESRDAHGMWTAGGGYVSESDKARVKSTLSLIHDDHKALVGKLHNGTIDAAGLDRLDSINKFVLKNRSVLLTLR